MGRGTNGDGVLVDVLNYRFRGLELDNGELSVDGIDPNDIQIQVDDEVPAPPRARAGKVVDKIVPVELRMLKTFDGEERGPDRTVKSVAFRLTCKNPTFTIRGTDLESMRKATWDFLDQTFAVKWEQYLLVRIEHTSLYHGGISNGFGFSYERIERGTAHDGSLLLRKFSRGSRGGYEVQVWPGEFKDRDGKLLACVPATDQNEAAMKEFMQMISQLRDRLAEHFRPDTIALTLANLGSLKMLGATNGSNDAASHKAKGAA